MGSCPMGNHFYGLNYLWAKVNDMQITPNNQTLEQLYLVQDEAAKAKLTQERSRYLDANFANIDYTAEVKAMEMSTKF